MKSIRKNKKIISKVVTTSINNNNKIYKYRIILNNMEITDAYLRQRFGTDLPQENLENLKTAMQKYDEKWWESEDPVQVARYQFFEPVLMSDFSKYHEGLEKLVGRPVWTHEALSKDGLETEMKEAIPVYDPNNGDVLAELDEETKNTRIANGIGSLTDYAQKTDKSVIGVQVDSKYK